MRKILTFMTALTGFGLLSAPLAWAGSVNLEIVDAHAQKIMKKPGMVGLAIAVIEDGELIFTKGYGETKKGSGDPVTADTVFRWASVSKSIAAATVLDLSEDGYFDIENPANLHAPSLNLPRSRNAAKIEDLMSHRTGIKRNEGDRKIEAGHTAKPLRGKLTEARRMCPPGTCHTYQNVAYDATAEIAETVTGLPYKSIVNERIFKPLGMTTATTTLAGLQRSKSWAKPHFYSGRTVKSVKPTYYRIPGAAGVNSSVTDLAKWMNAQMVEGDDVLSSSVKAAMQTPYVITPREQRGFRRKFDRSGDAFYGYGWRVYNYKGRRIVGHRGAVQGYRSMVIFDPELKTGMAMLWNTGTGFPIEMQMDVIDMAHAPDKGDLAGLPGDKALFETP